MIRMLWWLWLGLLLVSTTVRGLVPDQGEGLVVGRLASSGVLVALAWLLPNRILAVGMTLGAIGDGLLSDFINVPAAGMLAFGLGHVAYVAAARRAATLHMRLWGIWAAVSTAGWVALAPEANHPLVSLYWPSLVYTWLLAGTAASYPWGGLLFLLSDVLLSASWFRPDLHWIISAPYWSDFVWMLYGPAQMAIVFSQPKGRELLKQVFTGTQS